MRTHRFGGPHYPEAGPPGATVARPPPPSTRTKGAQPTEEELRAIRRASRAAASDAAWLEDEQEMNREEHAGGGAGSSGAPAAPPLPPQTRTRKFPRGHKFHAGLRLLSLPVDLRWGDALWLPPSWEICRKSNRLDCTGAHMVCPHERIHACSECGGGHPAPHCLVGEDDLPPPDPPVGPPQRPARGGR